MANYGPPNLDQETPGVTGKFGLGVQNEAGQRLIEFCQENALVIANTLRVKFLLKLSYLRYSITFLNYYVLTVGSLKFHCVLGLTAL